MQSTARTFPRRTAAVFSPELRQHGLLLVVVAIYATIAFALTAEYPLSHEGHDALAGLAANFAERLPGMIFFILFWRLLVMRFAIRPADPWGWMRRDIISALADRHRMISGFIGIALAAVIMISFGQLKRLIPIMHPFDWDTTFSSLDTALHFGNAPWSLAHAIAGNPFVITFVTGAYSIWFFLIYLVLLFACFNTGAPDARIRYLIAFVLCWGVGGNLIATIFSSAGPVYYERLGLGDAYAPLMDLLAAHAASQPISVIEPQDMLWAMYSGPAQLSGISAFPSMHVASSVLMTLYAFRLHRVAGYAMAAFTGVIMLGSVLLAWHYAVDGYAATVIAILSWLGAGWLMRAFPGLTPARPAPHRT